MGESEGEVIPQNGTEQALAEAAEQIVSAVKHYEPPLASSNFNLYDLLGLYNFGYDRVGSLDHDRWTAAFALAVSVGGVYAIRSGREILYLAIFWRTKNPHVRLSREMPKPDPNGNYVYLGWHWNDGKVPNVVRKIRDHMIASSPGVEFVCGHDNRPKVRKGRRGRLWVLEVKR